MCVCVAVRLECVLGAFRVGLGYVWDSFGMHFKMFEVREKCD